jgi:transposase-like protein
MSALNQPQFKDASSARTYLEGVRWPHGPVCPHCGSISKDHYALAGEAHREGLWKCKDCREQFTVTVGTVFERSKIGLHVWLQAVYLLCSSKKGMSAHQLHRTLGVTYKTAWFMAHRIREAMTQGFTGPLGSGGGQVEADETYIGNKRKPTGRGKSHKRAVFALVERHGKARSFHVSNVTGKTLKPILQKHVAKGIDLMTDQATVYPGIAKYWSHSSVNHSKEEYVRGDVHTNTVEGYFSILKRGIIGTYHHVSEAHLQRYCHEFDFRYNHRTALGVTDAERANAVLKELGGKRLTYRRTDATVR